MRYYTHCMKCTFCKDSCCDYGVDVDSQVVDKLLHTDLDIGHSKEDWFTNTWKEDEDFPSGKYTRTKVVDGACIFLNRKDRGCLIHSYCNANSINYHELKPMYSVLFPITIDNGVIRPSNEVKDGSLICLNDGPTLYDGVRSELEYYFGYDLVKELDGKRCLRIY